MLEVTNDAMQICTATVRQLSGAQSRSKCLRFIQRDKGVSISFEVPRSDDEIVEHDGHPIIAVPNEFSAILSTKTLDLNDDGKLVLT